MFTSFALAVFALVLTSAPACAQVLYGSIVGNVKDSTGAAVPDATVSATVRMNASSGLD